jgi:hypothetical protein
MFVPHVLGFLPAPIGECVVSRGCSRLEERGSIYLVDPIGQLKLHTVGDVDLSHSLGIDFGCAGYETEFDINADGWYD